jgi:hypothetical protein
MGDAEEALRRLGDRVVRLRSVIAGVCATFGFVAGVTGYLWLRELQLERSGIHSPYLTGLLGFAPPFLGCVWLASLYGGRWVRARAAHWIAELGREHRVDPERLRELKLIWD